MYLSRSGAGLEDAYTHLVPPDAPVDFQARVAESVHAIWVWLQGCSELPRSEGAKLAHLLRLIDLAAVRVAGTDECLLRFSYN
jgi:hypothetical protein